MLLIDVQNIVPEWISPEACANEIRYDCWPALGAANEWVTLWHMFLWIFRRSLSCRWIVWDYLCYHRFCLSSVVWTKYYDRLFDQLHQSMVIVVCDNLSHADDMFRASASLHWHRFWLWWARVVWLVLHYRRLSMMPVDVFVCGMCPMMFLFGFRRMLSLLVRG